MSHRCCRPLRYVAALAVFAGFALTAAAGPRPVGSEYTPVTTERLLSPEPHNWLMYRRTYNGWGYSPLDQITRANVASLEPVWTFSTGSRRDHQSPPIVNDGRMFVTAPLDAGGLQVLALDAATGDRLWRYAREPSVDARIHRNKMNRGVALYGDKVYVGTVDAHIVALDAVTGGVVWEQPVADPTTGYYITMAPLTVDGKVMVGMSGGGYGIRGFVIALDADTGREVWKTHTVPAPGEPGSDTWPGETWQTGGAPVWVTATYDPALNQTYWGTGNPGPWMGDVRPGDNLYTNSVLALDAATGEIAGYHQYHHNGSWDWDEVDPPLVLNIVRNGRTIPSLVHPGRNGYLWLLERRADGIGFVDAEPYVHQNVFTAIDPRTGRPSYDPERVPGTGKRAVFCPSHQGGKNWQPAAFNPITRLLYIPANENLCTSMEGSKVKYTPGRQFVGAKLEVLIRDGAGHIGELQAWNLDTGEQAWSREFESHNMGPVLTTAGGLVFTGGTNDRYFRAFDAESGEELWRMRTNSGVIGIPTAFAVAGRQYIAVQSGWGARAQQVQDRIDQFRGERTPVPRGGVIWVFALKR